MNRRGFIAGTLASLTAGPIEFGDTFEAPYYVEQFHEPGSWPDDIMKLAASARRRLLEKYPGTKIVQQTFECLGRDHPRWPDGVPDQLKYALLYVVRLDQAVGVVLP